MKFDEKSGMFFPDESVIENATIKNYEELYQYSIENREAFWSE